MEAVFRLSEDNLEEYVKFIPGVYLMEYVYNKEMFMYGLSRYGEACGVAILERDGEDISIHYLYIQEEYERQLLFSFVNSVACDMYKEGADRLVWKYLEDESGELRQKLYNLGFVSRKSDIAVFNFTIRELAAVPLLSMESHNTIALKKLDGISLKKLCSEIVNNGKDIIDMPLRKEDYITECSVVYIENNEPKGIMLLKQEEDGNLFIPFIYSNTAEPMAIIDMMRFMFINAHNSFEADTICRAYVVEPVLVKIVEKLTGIKGRYQQIAVRDLSNMEMYMNYFEL